MHQLLRHRQNLPLINVCTCSVRHTQQWPTELTGRCDSHWLSIHRSSPCVPALPWIGSCEILQEQTQGKKKSIFDNRIQVCVVFSGSLQVTALPLEQKQLPHGVAVTSSGHQEARHQRSLQYLSKSGHRGTKWWWDPPFREVGCCCGNIWDKTMGGERRKEIHQSEPRIWT